MSSEAKSDLERDGEAVPALGQIITLDASGTILPWYRFAGPPPGHPAAFFPVGDRTLHPYGRIDLDVPALSIGFRGEEISFFCIEPSASLPFNSLLKFICYRTFIEYNVLHLPRLAETVASPSSQRSQSVSFRLMRYDWIAEPRQEREVTITLDKASISTYLRVRNWSLDYAVAFYLIGCKNLRYCLVDFYKSIEAIENVLGGERELLNKLADYGIAPGPFKEFKKLCNAKTRVPIEITRHAPESEAALRTVDLRSELARPGETFGILAEAAGICRQVIDAYLAMLATAGSGLDFRRPRQTSKVLKRRKDIA
jgi:hypothetical protein